MLQAALACAFIVLGALWWGSEQHLKGSTMFAVAAALSVFSLDDLFWADARRPSWANAALGAVLAYFVVTAALLLTR